MSVPMGFTSKADAARQDESLRRAIIRMDPSKAATLWLPETGRDGYHELDDWEIGQIDQAVKTAVATMLDVAGKDLGISSETAVHWYTDESYEANGFTHWDRPDEIWLRKTGDWRAAMKAAAHELAHLAQFRKGFKSQGGPLREANEREATDYSVKMMSWFQV